MLIALLACGANVTTDQPIDSTDDDSGIEYSGVDADGDGVDAEEDCDDGDHTIFPGAEEICDGEDNDCNGAIDEGVSVTVYTDGDGDGYGDDKTAGDGCEGVSGLVGVGGDCDDMRADVHPGAQEICDGNNADEDCDGLSNDQDSSVDPDTMTVGYLDSDGDDYGDEAFSVSACALSGDYIMTAGDCDDSDAAVNPEAVEICDDEGIDEDCNGFEGDDDPDLDPDFAYAWYPDNDGDGYGDPAGEILSCSEVSGYIEDGTDCDDSDRDENPDLGCDWDGAYTGTVTLVADWAGLTDTCSGPVTVTVDDEAQPQLEGSLSCSWASIFSHIFGSITGTIEGELVDSSEAMGEISLSTKLNESFSGQFTAPGNLTLEMSGKGHVLVYDMTIDLAR